ncbi:hypothetical protein AB0O47_39140 [Streptomyces noursei]|uniref:hypothetical protein n=1 Tax=Streptomyces noursei TaxID=1971 RepID=UPI00344F2045
MTTIHTPPEPLDTPLHLGRQLLVASEHYRRLYQRHPTSALFGSMARLIEMRLHLLDALPSPGRPRKGPGRPTTTPDAPDSDQGHRALYEVAAEVRDAVMQLPLDQRADAVHVLADIWPALFAEPLEPEPVRAAVPAHLKPDRGAGPGWMRQQWGS